MASKRLIFGLAEHHYETLCEIFRRYPQIERVLIFGSRAKATDKPWSDFDLAVVAPTMNDCDFSSLWSKIDELPLVFKVDVLHLDRLEPGPLKERISTQGQFFYPLSMARFLEVREEIYQQFHGSGAGPDLFFKSVNQERYAAYYTSMYLLQDTAEALWYHRQQGFATDPSQAYLEYWGIMQALFVQQDALGELYLAVTGEKLKIERSSSWNKLRNLRNQSAGHPARRDRNAPLTRTFMSRDFGNYSSITMEEWNAATGNRSNPRHNLAVMIDAYEKEAVAWLNIILNFMKKEWPARQG